MRSLLASIDSQTTVLTVNQRLARSLHHGFAARQREAGLAVWETPDILSFDAWLERSWRELCERSETPHPVLLASAQERAIWEACVRTHAERGGETVLGLPGTAAQAQAAYRALRAWRVELDGVPLDEDAAAFRGWMRRFERRCRDAGWIAMADLGDAIEDAGSLARSRGVARLVLVGFDDRLSAQQRSMLRRVEAAGMRVERAAEPAREARAVRVAAPSPEEELEAAARWARARLERSEGEPICVVVPDLARLRPLVLETFERILAPGAILSAEEPDRPFNVSLGAPLAEHPAVCHALLLLGLALDPIGLDRVEGALGSSYLGAADAELAERARLAAALGAFGDVEIGSSRLLRESRSERFAVPSLAAQLGRFFALVREAPRAQSPAAWAQSVSRWLQALGWPGDRALGSAEQQSVAAFDELLSELAALSLVHGPLALREGLSRLGALAGHRVFQAKTRPAPVQILGVLESAGLEFSSLWVCGLDDAAWPAPPSPSPFLPARLQRELGLPGGSAEWQLAFAERTTARWLRSADEVVFSHAERIGDEERGPSPLVRHLEPVRLAALAQSRTPTLRQHFHACRPALERLRDYRVPGLAPERRWGSGTRLFAEQSACAFRAFATHRLGAASSEPGRLAMDAKDRGRVLHRALEELWKGLSGSEALASLDEAALGERLERSARKAIAEWAARRASAPGGRFAELERERLVGLLRRWLTHERERPAFTVREFEAEHRAAVAGLGVTIRPDRVDELPSGHLLLIDYKSGEANLNDWFGERPGAPQMPLYLTALESRGLCVDGLAFGLVRADEVGLVGLGAGDIARGIRPPQRSASQAARRAGSWTRLKGEWREVLEALGERFIAGDAEPAPATRSLCKSCPIAPVCRIDELERRAFESEDEP